MNTIQKCALPSKTSILNLISVKLAVVLTLFGVLAALPSSVQAAPVTQLAFLQTLVQVSGDAGQFSSSSTAQDYIAWAQAKGMNPPGGWQPTATLSKDQLAQLLVQLLNLNPKKGGGDYIRTLQREGINLGDDENVSSLTIATVFSESLLPRIPTTGSTNKRPNNGLGNGQQAPPPHNPNGDPHVNPPGNSGNAPGHNK